MEAMFPRSVTHNAMGRMKTNSLFAETARAGYEPIMSLRPGKEDGLPSLRDLYVKFCKADPTEALFAELVFGEWFHWTQLRDCGFMQPYLKEWREEADVKRKSEAFKALIHEVDTQGKLAIQVARYLIEEPWKGRTKAAKQEVAKTANKAHSGYSDDLERLKEEGLLQ